MKNSTVLKSIIFVFIPSLVLGQMMAEIDEDVTTDFGIYHPYPAVFSPNVPAFTVAADFSNVVNFEQFSQGFTKGESELLQPSWSGRVSFWLPLPNHRGFSMCFTDLEDWARASCMEFPLHALSSGSLNGEAWRPEWLYSVLVRGPLYLIGSSKVYWKPEALRLHS